MHISWDILYNFPMKPYDAQIVLGAVSIRKTVLLGMAIPMLKIRRPTGRLIFNMGIPIPGKTVFLIETAPSSSVPQEKVLPKLNIWNTMLLFSYHQTYLSHQHNQDFLQDKGRAMYQYSWQLWLYLFGPYTQDKTQYPCIKYTRTVFPVYNVCFAWS